jgi:RNA polymerase sigma-70 factor (ECF subfamily)
MSDALLRSAAAPAIRESFDEVVLPHLGAGRALARWLVRNEHDAEDVVQEASLRAFRYFRTFAGGDGRAWFLRIVRNACWDLCDRLAQSPTDVFDEELHSGDQSAFDPEAQVLRTDDGRLLEHAMGALPDRFRKLLVHRELDGLSYRELADVMDVPIGTVMSGLSRARQALRVALNNELKRPGLPARTTAREEEADAVLA